MLSAYLNVNLGDVVDMRKRLCMIISLLTVGLELFSVLGEDCQAYTGYFGKVQLAQSCPDFCCGSCLDPYCCANVFLKFDEQKFQCN